MKKPDKIIHKLKLKMWTKKAKEKGFLIYKDSASHDEEIQLLEKQIYKRSSVFVERIDNNYQTNYTKWDEVGAIEKVTVLCDGSFEKCFVKAVKFIEWMESKNNNGKSSE